jgi:hypothetical protein
MPAPRDNPEDLYYLRTFAEAHALFDGLTRGGAKRNSWGEVVRGTTMVGVFAGQHAIFEIGITGDGALGGEDLTPAQEEITRYDVSMSFRPRGPGRCR